MSERSRCLISLLLMSSIPAVALSQAAVPEGPERHYYVVAQGQYDDNLFRLPLVPSPAQSAQLAGASRFDFIKTGSLGFDGTFFLGIQELLVDLRLDYSRYTDNQRLNNISGNGKLEWDWQLTAVLSGKIGASYNRALASFANNYFFGKDSLNTRTYFGEINWLLGPHVNVGLAANHTESSHSATARDIDDYAMDSGAFNANYVDSHGNVLGWQYSYAKGRYPHVIELDAQPFDRSYHDNTSNFHAKYQLTGKLGFQGNYGYLKRDYPNADIGDFSGTIWRAALTYQATGKTSIMVSSWRDLNAYVDSQSDYFVTRGVSVGPTWQAFEKLSLRLAGSRERQNYIGSNLGPLFASTRRDVVTAGSATLSWQPRQYFSAGFSYKYEHRTSDISTLAYKDNLYGLTFQFAL